VRVQFVVVGVNTDNKFNIKPGLYVSNYFHDLTKNISLQGNTQSEFSPLTYKQITAFKTYLDNSKVMNDGGYNYVVNDGSDNTVASFNRNPQVFKNNTLVICGVDSLQAVQVFQVNNY